jgi:hypothetical protein
VVTGFAVAAAYAVAMLRGKRGEYYRRGLLLGMAMGGFRACRHLKPYVMLLLMSERI